MILPLNSEATIIHRLRVHVTRLDSQAAQLRAAYVLNTADLRPPGLPPSVILCVRRMLDPCPGGFDLRQPGAVVSHAWQSAVKDSLAELARVAARPAREPVPAGAEAVLFADKAEFLACLARDWLNGRLLERWWWQSLLRGQSLAEQVTQAWVESPAYLSAALEELAANGDATAFTRHLQPVDAGRILAAGLTNFGLTALQPVVSLVVSDLPGDEYCTRDFPPPPWRYFAPESVAAGLHRAGQALLGLGLGLNRALPTLGSRSFSSDAQAWAQGWFDESAGMQDLPQKRQERRISPASMVNSSLQSEQCQAPAVVQSDLMIPEMPELPTNISTHAGAGDFIYEMKQEQKEGDEQPSNATNKEVPLVLSPMNGHNKVPSGPLAYETTLWPQLLAGEWFDTGFGGLFYLVNLGLFLELYNDFTRPLEPGIGLPLWDFLAMVGRELCGPVLEEDPIWRWLARLAGRDVTRKPGCGFQAPTDWRMPSEWLQPFLSSSACLWSEEGGRLRVWHPAGFWILDVLREDQLADQIEMEFAPYQGLVRIVEAPELPESLVHNGFPGWLDRLMAYLRVRLLLALGLDESDNLPGLLCARPARVYLTETHLDITFSLAHLPVEVRRSGLDRDPGWVPAAHRYIRFIYES